MVEENVTNKHASQMVKFSSYSLSPTWIDAFWFFSKSKNAELIDPFKAGIILFGVFFFRSPEETGDHASHYFSLVVPSKFSSCRFSSRSFDCKKTRLDEFAIVWAISRAASICLRARNAGLFAIAWPISCALLASPCKRKKEKTLSTMFPDHYETSQTSS